MRTAWRPVWWRTVLRKHAAATLHGRSRWIAHLALLATLAASGCREQEAAFARIPGADVERGRAIIATAGCGACHVVPGVRGARGLVGPPLTSFGARAYIAGRVPNEPDALVSWLMDPQSIDSLTAMPAVGLDRAEARDVAAYLFSLGTTRRGPPALLPRSWLDAL
ncbi:MAG TPA: c-type cytochrome [Longimicrobiales bacterium]|nr:c-type cytochrome [Longimicrobiales bacterium]